MNYVITLVHGTWASNAPWIQEDSSLCRSLKSTLPGPIILKPFIWSGRNSISARNKAADRLRKHLSNLVSKWPTAQHLIIAHSHGGNVALYALRDHDLANQIRGLVCLSTPFLVARKRDLGPFGRNQLWVMLLFLLLMFIVIAQFMLYKYYPTIEALASSLPSYVEIILICVGVGGWLYLFFKWEAWGDSIVDKLKLPMLTRTQLLIIRSTGDEASSALSGLQVFGWFLTRLWAIPSKFSGYLLPSRERLFLYPLPKMLIFIFLLRIPGSLLMMLTTLLLIPVISVISILSLAFGSQLFLVSPFVDITVEAAPPGSFTVHHLPVASSKYHENDLGTHKLAHSLPYEDGHSLSLITQWILRT